MNCKGYVVFTSMDINQILTSRPNHLLNFLSSVPDQSTFIYRMESTSKVLTKDSKGNVSVLGLMFPLRSKVFMPLIGIWFFLYVLLIDRSRHRVAIGMGPWAGLSCLLLRSAGRVDRFVYEDFDFFPGFQKNIFLRGMVSSAEILCLRKADLVVSVSESLAQRRKEEGRKEIIIIPNGVSYGMFEKAQRKKPHPPTLVYAGLLEERRGIDLVIRAMPIILRAIPETRFLVAGKGNFEKELKELVGRLELKDSVKFLGEVEYSDLPVLYTEADIGVVMFAPTALFAYSYPIKIMEYMAGGLSIIGTKVGEIGKIIEKYKVGKAIPFSSKSFAEATVELLSDRSKFKGYAENALQASKEYDWEKLFNREFSAIEKLV